MDGAEQWYVLYVFLIYKNWQLAENVSKLLNYFVCLWIELLV